MNQERYEEIVNGIEDSSLRKVAEKYPHCLHPCVWLVKDKNGPLVAGGKPRLPVGREWPREHGEPLAYLLSIDASLLPEWSPLPPDCGTLLVFVGHLTCQIVVVGRGVEVREVEPPLEEYLSKQPTAGEVLETVRFRLEDGLHAGVPDSWTTMDEGLESRQEDESPAGELSDVSHALRPADSIGRLFGHHEWWVGVDAASITRYSYLDVNGYPGGWYEDLDNSVNSLEQQLEEAKRQQPPPNEQVPVLAEAVVEACEKWVANTEKALTENREKLGHDSPKKLESARRTLARRRKHWQKVQTADSQAANKAFVELMRCVADIEHQIEARLRPEYAHDPGDLQAALQLSEESKATAEPRWRDLVQSLTAMQYAAYKSNGDEIRQTWLAHEAKLNQYAPHLRPAELATALDWRSHCYQELIRSLRSGYVDPETLAEKVAAIQWWQKDPEAHEAELSHWGPLLVMTSDHGPYSWGNAGWAIILADYRQVEKAELGRLAIAVDVT